MATPFVVFGRRGDLHPRLAPAPGTRGTMILAPLPSRGHRALAISPGKTSMALQ
jgi:hypothetical protein